MREFAAKRFINIILLITLTSFCAAAGAQRSSPADAQSGTVAEPGVVPSQNVVVVPEGDKSTVPKRKDEAYEDWSKPELTPGMQSRTELIDQVQEDKFTRELIHAQWREFDPIDLTVIKPVGVAKPPVILYLYSYPPPRNRYLDAGFCEFLTRNGFAAVGFSLAVSGQRFHDRPTAEWFVSQLQEALGASVHDVQMTLNYLASRGDLDTTRVGVWGDGAGASVAIMAAAVDPRIKILDVLDPWGDWPNWLAKSPIVPENERARYLKPEFLKSVAELDPVKWLPRLGKDHVRLQYITGDLTVTPTLVRKDMEAAAPPSIKIVHYKDAHTFRKEVASTGKGFEWLKQHLEYGQPPASHGRAQNATQDSLDQRNSR